MIGILYNYSTLYLWVAMTLTFFVFCIPILFIPLKWAEFMKWSVPADNHLTIYFGRCLGAFILVFEYAIFRAIYDESIRPFVFDLALGISALMTAVHLYGALKKIQPMTETIEIAFYSLLFVLTLIFYPVT
mmetsp:Transcript_3439/g.2045  ORF Transcript_3439/g.2045 Transcript_3439/m.2045 type:complete len:131 (+) Transcript_3439:1371-1763(+)